MATLREIEDALRAADAAGNREDVLALADERDRLLKRPTAGPPSVGGDVVKAAFYAVPKAAVGMAGLPADLLKILNAGGESLAAKIYGGKPEDYRGIGLNVPAGGSDIRGAIEKATGPWFDPQTRAGKATDTAVQTAALMGKNWLTAPKEAAKIVAGTTLGTEAAGAATDDNPWMRMLGGIFGGGVPAVANATRSRTGQVVRDAIGTPTQSEIDAALAMQARGRVAGVPLMGTESLDRGSQLASAIYASPAGNSILERFLAQRPEQVKSAVEGGLLAQVGPRAVPAANAARAQEAATAVIGNAERARTGAVNALYDRAQWATIPPQAMRPVANEIQNQLFKTPIDSPADAAIGRWHKQAFPYAVEAPEVEAAARAVKGVSRSVDVQQDDVITAIRKLGGINPADEAVGSLAKANPFPNDPRFGPVWRRPGFGTSTSNKTVAGHSLDDMAAKLYEQGYIPERNPDLVMDAVADATMGRPLYSVYREVQSVDPLAQAIDKLTAQLAAKNAPKATAPIAPESALPETNVGRLTKLYQNLRDERALPSIGATSEQKAASYPAGKVQDVLGDVLRANNPDFRRANERFAAYTEKVVNPLTAGPIGVIAGRTGFDPAAPSQVPRVINAIADPNVARPETIRHVYSRLNRVDKQAFPGMVQTHLENQLNAALTDIRSGGNPTAGAKFRQAIVGTPQEQTNFDEMMRGVAKARGANPDDLVRGANNLLQVLERTGRTPGVGSQTQPRQEIAKELGKTKIGDVAMVASAAPTKTAVARWNDLILRRRYEGLAQALTAEDSVQTLLKLAKIKPNGITASYYAAVLLGLDEATSGQ